MRRLALGKYVNSGDVCRVLSLRGRPFKYERLAKWISQGLLKPVHNPGGTGNHRLFEILDVLALAICLELRAYGHELALCKNAMQVIQKYGETKLIDHINAGCTHLLIDALGVQKKLVDPAKVSCDQSFVVLMDVYRIYCRIKSKFKYD